MKTLGIALVVLVLVGTPLAAGQEQEAEVSALDQLMADFGRGWSGYGVSFVILHLNDLTTDAFFEAPLKYQLRAQARAGTVFYVQGTADVDTELSLDFRVQHGQDPFPARTVNITNFEPGTQLSAGQEFLGLVAVDRHFEPGQFALNKLGISVIYGSGSIDFTFAREVIEQLTEPAQ